MRFIPMAVGAALSLMAATALAQSPTPGQQRPSAATAAPVDQEFARLGREWAALGLQIEHLQDSLNAYGTAKATERQRLLEIEKALTELRAYATACGDMRGCFVPVPEKHSEANPDLTPRR